MEESLEQGKVLSELEFGLLRVSCDLLHFSEETNSQHGYPIPQPPYRFTDSSNSR